MPKYDITVQLVGEDGNASSLIGKVAKAIRRHAGDDAAKAFVNEAMSQPSYEHLLGLLQETVNVE